MAENLTKNITFAEGEIGNALKSTSGDHVVAAAQNIYDTDFGGYQSEINQYFDDKFDNQSEINKNFTEKFNDYLPLAGGTLTGDLTIKRNSSDSPSIILQRAETNDTFEDWRMANVAGYFKIQNRNSENTWTDVLSLAASATKTLTSSYSVLPSANNTLTLGNSTYKWKDVYATNFLGKATTASYLDGNAATSVNSCHGDKILKYYTLSGCTATEATGNKRYAGTDDSYGFPVSNNANGLLWLGNHSTNYGHQLGFSSDGNIYHRKIDNGSFPTTANGGSWKKLAFTSDIPAQYTHPTSGVTTGSYGPSTNATPSYGGSFNVPYITVNAQGHITSASNKSITIPSIPVATDSALGGIKIGYTQSGKNYPVQLDSNNKAYVNVPWTDTDTNTDTKVTQTVTAVNANYPLLLAPAGQTATTTTTSYFDSGVTLNPSNNILSGAKVYESLLQWGNINISGSLSPLDVAMDSQWSSNRLSFMPASGIDIKYSTDGGTTWSDYGSTDEEKRSLVTTGLSYSLSPGKNTTRQKINSDRVRVTITAESGKTYFSLKKIYMYISQNGASDCKVLIEKSQCGSDTTFTQVGEYAITGWSGWNSIPLTASFGGGDTQTGNIRRIRLTFYFEKYSTGYGETDDKNAVKFTINKINMIGETSWSNSGGNLPVTGHIYSYDINKNVTFPAGMTTTSNLTVKGNTTLGDAASDTVTISGKATINNGLVLSPSNYNNTIKIANTDFPMATAKLFMGANGDFIIRSTFSSDSSTSDLRWNKTSLKVGNEEVLTGTVATTAEISALFN